MFSYEVLEDIPKLQPRWLRVPTAAAYSGISRARLYLLLSDGEIKSASVRARGRGRGIRVVDRESIDAFLEKNLTTGTSAE